MNKTKYFSLDVYTSKRHLVLSHHWEIKITVGIQIKNVKIWGKFHIFCNKFHIFCNKFHIFCNSEHILSVEICETYLDKIK